MFWQIFSYELKYKFRRPGIYIYWLVLFAFMFLIISALGGNIENISVSVGGLGGNVNLNSPYLIYLFTAGFSYLAMILLPATIGTSIYKDFKNNTHTILFSYPISKWGYLGGRFLGAFIPTLFIFTGLVTGYMAAIQMPWIDPGSIGAFRLDAYLQPFITSIIPNILLTGLIIFGLAALTRDLLSTYLGCILIIVLYGIGSSLMSDMDNQVVASLIDPLGSAALENTAKYWTVSEKNALLLPITWEFMANRIIWLMVSGAIFLFSVRKFQFTQHVFSFKLRKKARLINGSIQPILKHEFIHIPKAKKNYSVSGRLRQFYSLMRREFLSIIRNPYFIAIMITALVMLSVNAGQIGKIYGTTTFPVTYKVTEMLGNTFYLFMIIIITFYAGELVWRERDHRLNGIIHTMPLPNWILYSSKLTALSLLGLVLMAIVMIFGMFVQIFKGYFSFQAGLYLSELGILYIDYLLLAVLAVAIHTLVNNKYVGHFIMVIYFILDLFMFQFGLEHNLYKYASDPGIRYSAMNGYGHFVGPFLIYKAYWASLAVLLGIVSNLFWIRGSESNWKIRVRQMRHRLSLPAKLGIAGTLIVFLFLGGLIFYNTNVLNDFSTTKESRQRRADYEKQYSQYEKLVQPRITDVNVNLDIYPERRDFEFKGYYLLKNKSDQPIDTIIVSQDSRTTIRKMNLDRIAQLVQKDEENGLYMYSLKQALLPGDTTKLSFEVAYITKGFKNRGSNTDILANGSFIHSSYIPSIGYDASAELYRKKIREKLGLPYKAPIASIDDSSALMDTYITRNSDWVNFETTVSTNAGQTAIAPGYLIHQWEKNGRKYFHYKMDSRVLNFFAWLSADYEVRRDRWKDVDIAVYYQEEHAYNVDDMIQSVKSSLDYYTHHFSPYQYRQVRILEFPRFASYAQAFPNTIPFSESIGFIADVDKDDINYPYWVTAHEMAHQWWAHQVVGGKVEGCTVMSEVLAQYSSTMVMLKEFGKKVIKDFMDHNQHSYLQGRTNESLEENPLLYVRPDQGYIHYNKGAVAMYALQDYLGENRLNKAISDFTRQYAFQEAPFTRSVDFYQYIQSATPDSLAYLTEDLFERMVVYENRVNDYKVEENDSGQYNLTINLETRKYEADSLGQEKEIEIRDWIDVAVIATEYQDGNFERDTLHFKKHMFRQSQTQLKLVVDKKPTKVSVDPYFKLIDKHRDDNSKSKSLSKVLM